MAIIHHLIREHGRTEARRMVDPEERVLVDVAADVMSVERPEFGTVYTGFAFTSLPHRKLETDATEWRIENGPARLTVMPGKLPTGPDGELTLFGVPYGAHARLILIYLQTQAVRSKSREIEVGRSLGAFLERVGIPTGGKNYRSVRDQLARIAACNLMFTWQQSEDAPTDFVKSSIIKGGRLSFAAVDARQGALWEERVVLSEDFFDHLKKHPVPLMEQALRAIGSHSMALDVYVWLAYRLHHLKRPTPIRWSALHKQFGIGYGRERDFKRRFIEPLKLALAAYPEAHVEVEDTGLLLYPSAPPLPAR
ncbi:MAG: hypothetical protein RLY86_2754 [Pseudomonadota bacterium]|jgi:hypothetical protein